MTSGKLGPVRATAIGLGVYTGCARIHPAIGLRQARPEKRAKSPSFECSSA